ncbi:hypothetical protein [Nonomuraea typhae]|uniref:hypothetical protein n=1 Tax=Nonomuraea typhae TaxID=2603600 RepID=UPI0012FA9636|nr:hypothetical protein [Nonomuraea typhae]
MRRLRQVSLNRGGYPDSVPVEDRVVSQDRTKPAILEFGTSQHRHAEKNRQLSPPDRAFVEVGAVEEDVAAVGVEQVVGRRT